MNTSLLKKIVSAVSTQWATAYVLGLVDTLLVMMKKYGKQVSQPSMRAFIEKEYPDVLALFTLVGGSRFTIKQCLLLRQYLREAMGDEFQMVDISHQSGIDHGGKLWDSSLLHLVADHTNPLLSVHSTKKVYQRSFFNDLNTLVWKSS